MSAHSPEGAIGIAHRVIGFGCFPQSAAAIAVPPPAGRPAVTDAAPNSVIPRGRRHITKAAEDGATAAGSCGHVQGGAAAAIAGVSAGREPADSNSLAGSGGKRFKSGR